MNRAALVALLLLLATGCGGAAESDDRADAAAGAVSLGAVCPGAHQVYDALVASNPASQAAFVDHLTSLRAAGDGAARDALDPVITAAKALAAAGRGPRFSTAQDQMYRAVLGLDAACRREGSYILH